MYVCRNGLFSIERRFIMLRNEKMKTKEQLKIMSERKNEEKTDLYRLITKMITDENENVGNEKCKYMQLLEFFVILILENC
jgi:hypothetical protein